MQRCVSELKNNIWLHLSNGFGCEHGSKHCQLVCVH